MRSAEAEDALTAGRRESKFLLDPREARTLMRLAEEHLAPHAYTGRGANALPGAHHYITTVYFDTDDGDIFRRCLVGDSDVKVRAREYYDEHPDLVELATDARQLIRYNPVVWLEIKHRHGSRTGKRRVGLPKREIPAFFEQGEIRAALITLLETQHGDEATEILAELRTLLGRFSRPLRACALVNYRRRAWQSAPGDLPLTLDDGLAVFAPPPDLWSRATPLTRNSLGTRCAVDCPRILEVKRRTPLPGWLEAFVAGRPEADLPTRPGLPFSKFMLAYEVVRG